MTRKKPHLEEPPDAEADSATVPEAEVKAGAGAEAKAGADAPANPLEAEVTRLRAREEELLRALAEMSNVQKRRKQETDAVLRYATESLVLDLLPVLDDLERALASNAGDPNDPVRAGVTLVRERLLQILRREGLEPIPAKGAPFDPTVHDAIAMAKASANVAPGTVIEEASPGYRFKDRVLRHAKVVVADGPGERGHATGGAAEGGEAAS